MLQPSQWLRFFDVHAGVRTCRELTPTLVNNPVFCGAGLQGNHLGHPH
jgi:hypothetical protein